MKKTTAWISWRWRRIRSICSGIDTRPGWPGYVADPFWLDILAVAQSKKVSRLYTGQMVTIPLSYSFMGNTLAIHWAATTHGTWLHGNPHGSWRNGKLIGPDPFLEAECRARMTSDAVVLTPSECALVANAFGEIVSERRHRVLAATVQATHVHLVFAPLKDNATNAIARLKRRSSMAVFDSRRVARPARMAGLYSRPILGRQDSLPHSLWTAGKFIVYIFSERHLLNVIEYIRDHNRRARLPADPFAWIDSLYPAPHHAGERCFQDAALEPRL